MTRSCTAARLRGRVLAAPLVLGLVAGCLASFDDRPLVDAGPPADAAPLPDGTSLPDGARTDAGPGCGNGELEAGEACDDGPGNSDTTPDACRTSCALPTCGDGVVDPGGGEACDDGNLTDGDGCSSFCAVEALPVLHAYTSIATGWIASTLTWAGDPHAPTTPVVAAAGMEPGAEALVFTSTTWHLLTLPGGDFTESGTLDTTFPGLPGASLQTATGQYDQGAARHTVMFLTGGMVYLYSYAGSPGSGTTLDLGPVDPTQQADWQTPDAPSPVSVVSDLLDLYNTHGWVTATTLAACGTGPDQPVVAYAAFLTPDAQLHLYEAAQCFEFFATVPLATFGPFAEAGAPTSGIAAMLYLEPGETLYVITQ